MRECASYFVLVFFVFLVFREKYEYFFKNVFFVFSFLHSVFKPFIIMASLPWVEKFRPDRLQDIKGHQDVIQVLQKYGGIASTPHLLFYGPPGTGKTSTILAMAKQFYGQNIQSMMIEINASDDRGIDIIKDRVKNFCQSRSLFGSSVKLIILDEADALTSDAQSALRRIIELYTKYVRFCLCCNYVGKITPAIQSRCTRFRFEGISNESLKQKAKEIVMSENIVIEDSAIDSILDLANGDARRVINLLQVCHMATMGSDKKIDSEYVYRSAGAPLPVHISEILENLLNESFEKSFNTIRSLVEKYGYSMAEVISAVSKLVLVVAEENHSFDLSIIFSELSNIEMTLSKGGSEFLSIGAVVSAFHVRDTNLNANP